MKIIDCVQGTPEWYAARAGIPTASEFCSIVSEKRDGKKTAAYDSLLMRLAGERITGEVAEPASSIAIARGHDLEPEVRLAYELITDAEPKLIGFIISDDGNAGYSPDAFVGENGLLEIKTKKPEFLIKCISDNKFPEEHEAQCQGGLWITGREWIDIMVYWPKLPPFIRRAYRDENYIKRLSNEVAIFNDKLDALVEKVKNFNTFEKEAA